MKTRVSMRSNRIEHISAPGEGRMSLPSNSAWKYVKLVFNLRTENPVAHHILLVLANTADRDGYCFPSYRYLMERTGYGSKHTIACALKFLRDDLGVLSWKRGWGNKQCSHSNDYRLDYDALVALCKKQLDAQRSELPSPTHEPSDTDLVSTSDKQVSANEAPTKFIQPASKFAQEEGKSSTCTLTSHHNTTSDISDRPISQNYPLTQSPESPTKNTKEGVLKESSPQKELDPDRRPAGPTAAGVHGELAYPSPRPVAPLPGSALTPNLKTSAPVVRQAKANAINEIERLKLELKYWDGSTLNDGMFSDDILKARARIKTLEDFLVSIGDGGQQ